MLPIFLCEDNIAQLNHIKHIIENFILIENLDMKLLCATTSPDELLRSLKEYQQPALYFLDIDLSHSLDGFDLAEKIREADPRGFIVFITSHSEYSHIVFERQLEAMDFILKDHPDKVPERILACMNKALSLFSMPSNNVHRTLSIKTNSRYISVPMKDIYLITTCKKPHKLRLLSGSVVYEFFATLQDITPQLDSSFFLCHKSCIVNLNYIKTVDKSSYTITLKNGLTCPLSVRSYSSLMKQLNASKSIHPFQ